VVSQRDKLPAALIVDPTNGALQYETVQQTIVLFDESALQKFGIDAGSPGD
jgi:hypothetical protein